MKYRVTLDGQEREVDVQVSPGGAVSVAMDGAPVDVEVVRVPGGVSLRMGNQVHDVLVGGPADAMQLAAGAVRTTVSVESERARAKRAKRGAAGAGKELKAPMPGRIVKVLVAAGDEVAANQPLVVIEAMKMENELRATAAVKIASVDVREGQNVEGGAILVRFE